MMINNSKSYPIIRNAPSPTNWTPSLSPPSNANAAPTHTRLLPPPLPSQAPSWTIPPSMVSPTTSSKIRINISLAVHTRWGLCRVQNARCWMPSRGPATWHIQIWIRHRHTHSSSSSSSSWPCRVIMRANTPREPSISSSHTRTLCSCSLRDRQ